jgi:stage III sporulation protein AH
MILKSKQVLTATLIIALGAAVAVNWYYTNTPDVTADDEITTQAVSGNLGDSLYVGGTTASNSDVTTSNNNKVDKQEDEYFAQAKLKRKQSHDEIIDNIEDILESDDIDSNSKNTISILLSDYKDDIKAETDTENLISAKIGGECLVIINEGACQVILKKNTLNDLLILQITEIIEKNTEISSENLTIIEAK